MLALIQCVNGNYSVVAEGLSEQSAMVQFHDRCKILWNATDVINANVAIVDEKLKVYNGRNEYIYHNVEPTESDNLIETDE